MKTFAFLFLAYVLVSCSKTVTVHDRGEAFAHDTTMFFSEYRGEPGPVAREMTFDIKGQISIVENFFQPVRPDPIVVAISPDSVRMLVELAIESGFFAAQDSAFEEPDEDIHD